MYTPAGNERTSHGIMEQKLTPAISRSSLVSESVSNGAAACTIPSPMLETPVAVN
jgi:hypothetical protein